MNPLLKEVFAQARQVVETGASKSKTIATAESCTGGLIGGSLTAIPGSSSVYLGGITAYHNSVKIHPLGVSRELLNEHGAVSEPVALAMARGVLELLNVDLAVSVTGIAGPGGGTPEKPVGTVWMGLANRKAGQISVSAQLLSYGDIGRNRVRDNTVLDALKALNAALLT